MTESMTRQRHIAAVVPTRARPGTGPPKTWTEYLEALHFAFVSGMDYADSVNAERANDESHAQRNHEAADFARMARRIRAKAGEPSHEQLLARRRRHQVDAAARARQAERPWSGEVAGE